MRVLVVGAGAMGSAAGGFLGQAGHDVTLLDREELMGAVRAKGLRITGIWGEHQVMALNAKTDLTGMKRGDFDLIIISVKSYDTRAAAESIRSLLDDDTLVCSYQNGLGNAEQIAAVAGWERMIGARVIFGVRLVEPGWIEITVIANPTALGVYHASAPVPDQVGDRVRAMAAAMDSAGIPTVYTDEIATLLWGKVAYNCALNPLSGLLDVPYGVLSETGHTLEIMREVIAEVYAVAGAMRIRLEPDNPAAYMDVLVKELIPPTATHYASMREDFRLKRRTEIDAMNGAIWNYGKQYGIPCPANAMLTRLVHAREHALGVKVKG